MAKNKIVEFNPCPTGKRSFSDERDAEKALGRARAKRLRGAGDNRRGLAVENRYYPCIECDGFHLTHMSRSSFNALAVA